MTKTLLQGLRAGAVCIALVALIASTLGFETGAAHAAPVRAPDVILTGTLSGAAHETYTEVPFRTPAGLERITVEKESSLNREIDRLRDR